MAKLVPCYGPRMEDLKDYSGEGVSPRGRRRLDWKWIERVTELLAALGVVVAVVYLTHWLAAGDALTRL
jgi:hypothetical protein